MMAATRARAVQALAGDLQAILDPRRILTTPEDLLVYGYDGTWLEQRPDLVVVPTNTAEIADIVRIAQQHRVPIVPRGGGSGLAGGAIPGAGSIVLSTTQMNRILEIDPHGLIARVQAGVVNAALQAAVEPFGLFYPPDPASLNQATIGGNVATSASGPRCLKYGGTKDYVIGLEVITPGGEVVRLGGRSHQPTDEQHLLQLFIGSEGTLGVVSEIVVRLLPKPDARGTVKAIFDQIDAAGQAVSAILASGVVPLALEMMDQTTLRCVEEYLLIGLPIHCEALLLIDVDGDEDAVREQLGIVAERCRASGAASVEIAATAAESAQLWQARRAVSSSFGRLRPNKLGEDISVPRTAIPSMVRAVGEIARAHALVIPLFGHIGDGNLHPNILCDLRDREEMERVSQAARSIFSAALERGGTLSGEHGIGLLKRDFLPDSLDPAALTLMRRIKSSADRDGRMNPGKVLDTAG